MNRVTLYFMSGTGNSYRTSVWMGELAEKRAAETRVVAIEAGRPDDEVKAGPDQLIGLVFPTHGFTAPWHMIRFALRLPRKPGAVAFCLATRAGTKYGRLFAPGLAGTAAFLIALILALKGYPVRGIMSLNMPSNWISLHPGFSEANARAINGRSRPKAEKFMTDILDGRQVWVTKNNLYEFIVGMALAPISVLYLLVGRFYLAKLFFASNKCNGCGICAHDCPVSAIKMTGIKNPRPFWRYNCESCMRCMNYCPEQAIEAGHSWAVIIWQITTIPVGFYFFSWLGDWAPRLSHLDSPWSRELVQILYIYPTLFLSYALFHQLLRIPAVNSLFTYTTLTRIYRRYHEPDTKRKEIVARKTQSATQAE